MKTKFVSCLYTDLYGTEFGGRSSRKHHYRYSLSSILKITNADFVLYTSRAEYDELCHFFYKEKDIPESHLKILTFELKDSKYFEKIKQKKDLEKMKTLDRCYEIQYNKFFWLKEQVDEEHDYFYWIDAGLSHCGIIPPEYRILTDPLEKYYNSTLFNNSFLSNLVNKTNDKLYIIAKNNTGKNFWSQTVPAKHYTVYDRSLHIIGGLFGGNRFSVERYVDLFDQNLNMLLCSEKELYFEELIMSLIFQNHKENFVADVFDTWWSIDSAPPGIEKDFFDSNKSFYRILADLQQ